MNNIDNNSEIRVVIFSKKRMVSGKIINVIIVHPDNVRNMGVELDDSLSVEEVINELIASNFIKDSGKKASIRY